MFNNAPTMRTFVPICQTQDGQETIPELWEDETLNFQLKNVQITNSKIHPYSGTLFITSKRVVFLGDNSSIAFDFDVPFIVLHAVSRDPLTYPRPCIYCELDSEEVDLGESDFVDGCSDGEVEMVNDTHEATDIRGNIVNHDNEWKELIIVPEDENNLMSIFEALSHAALLNPDPEEEGDNEDFIYNLEEVNLGVEQTRVLNHLENVFHFPVISSNPIVDDIVHEVDSNEDESTMDDGV